MKNKDLKELLEKKLHQLLSGLKITKPSAKVKSLLKKTSKKLAQQLKSDLKKLDKKKRQVAKRAKKAVVVKL
jgi:hypothetical protein